MNFWRGTLMEFSAFLGTIETLADTISPVPLLHYTPAISDDGSPLGSDYPGPYANYEWVTDAECDAGLHQGDPALRCRFCPTEHQ